MNALIVVAIVVAILAIAYIFYGGWLARQWGVDPDRPTPAHELGDGDDFVAAPPHVVFGHHFASIAGAGVVFGPIMAAVFGWVPIVLWIVVGGVFFGAVHDFGALFASIRQKGASLAAMAQESVGVGARRLICAFAYLLLVLLIAALASIVASTFQVTDFQAPEVNARNSSVAAIAVLFTVVAIAWGAITHGRRVSTPVGIVVPLVLVVGAVAVGFGLTGIVALGHEVWMVILGVYIFAAAAAPVWLVLQPRDYLSSFLLYGVLALALVGIVGAGIVGAASDLQIPAFNGFVVNTRAFDVATGTLLVDDSGVPLVNAVAQGGFLFPVLFVTVSCGALSGFHGLVASGTTSKQIGSENQARPIAFGGMLLTSLVAVISLCAVGFVWAKYAAGSYASPAQVFADGLSGMLCAIPGLEGAKDVTYALMILAVSTFCLTSLDTAVRLARSLFQELWVAEEQSLGSASDFRKTLANKYVATAITVVLGIALGMGGYSVIWPLFGAANQLLAALALLVICAWLGRAGKGNAVLFVPMALTFVVTVCSLVLTVQQKAVVLMTGGDPIVASIQLAVAVVLIIFAVHMAVKGVRALRAR